MGSGKSSILNLLSEAIKERHQHALVVRFDPWLISGRNDLISAFITELLRTIQGEPGTSFPRLRPIFESYPTALLMANW
jgi:KAP-like P-loop domain-containing protein